VRGRFGYHPGAWRHEVKWQPFEFEAASAGPFPGAADLFGDGSVVAYDTSGHTPGHTILELAGATRPVIHLGDAAFRPADFTGPAPRPNVYARASAWDRARMRRVLAGIAELKRTRPDVLLVCAHDPEVVAGRRASDAL
jgi:glyoxylase-like metal-dependent hydrolase (beta-lactamase superfamily II)